MIEHPVNGTKGGGDIAGIEPFLASDMGLADEEMRLEDAPVGLFMRDGELCLKTEYIRLNGAVDAYIVSSGEAFWGPAPQTVEHQRACLVTPVDWEQERADRLKLEKYNAVLRNRIEEMERRADEAAQTVLGLRARIRLLEQQRDDAIAAIVDEDDPDAPGKPWLVEHILDILRADAAPAPKEE